MKKFENPIVEQDYGKLLDMMKECADCGNLPQMLEMEDISGITLEDVRELMVQFRQDTGLDMSFSAELCSRCERLHAFLHVDYPEEDEILQ